jgi:hypothetical protein
MKWNLFWSAGGVALLLPVFALAGPAVRSTHEPASVARPAAAPTRTWWRAGSVSIVITPPAPPQPAPITVRLRGPGGEVRTFPVEGGPEAIQVARPVVLHRGQAVTIRLRASR